MAIFFRGNFETDPIWMLARHQLEVADRAAKPEDVRWGLWEEPSQNSMAAVPQDELVVPLLEKLGDIPRADVVVLGTYESRPGGATGLLGKPESGPQQNMSHCTEEEVRAWLAGNPTGRLLISVKVAAGRDTNWPGYLVEILVHELAAHAEPFADFLRMENSLPGIGSLGTEADQHQRLHTGNPRYRLLGACYLEQFPEEGNGPEFCNRALLDTEAKATLPPGVARIPARYRRGQDSA